MSSIPPIIDASRCRRLNTLLYVRRFADCVAFYRDGLGLPEQFANAWFVEFAVNPGACLSVVEKARSAGTLLNPIKLVRFLDAATKSVATDPDLASLNLPALLIALLACAKW